MNMILFVIDDDEFFQFIIERILFKINPAIKIESYNDGEEGIIAIKEKLQARTSLPDVVLLDINMPYMNGWGFMEEFKKIEGKINKQIQIYMLTSSNDPDDLAKAKRISELSGYMVKPVTEEELELVIKDFPLNDWYQPNT